MQSKHTIPGPGPCPRCQGTLAFGQDMYGAYLQCRNCGMLEDLSPFSRDPVAVTPTQDAVSTDGTIPLRPADSSTEKARNPCEAAEPGGLRDGERQGRYHKRFEIITAEGLSISQAAARFQVSTRTVYRILKKHRPRSSQLGASSLEDRIYTKSTKYRRPEVHQFTDSVEDRGQLSNTAFGYPLTVNGMEFQSPEGLYQALKFPDLPEVQKDIASRMSGAKARRASYQQGGFQADWWERIRLPAMMYTEAVRLQQHPEVFARALAVTEDLDIVAVSHSDPFWGARPESEDGGLLRGANLLGNILTRLREVLERHHGNAALAAAAFLEDVPLTGLLIDGKPVPRP